MKAWEVGALLTGRGETDRRQHDAGREAGNRRHTVRRITDRRFAELLGHFGGGKLTPDVGEKGRDGRTS